MLIGEHLATALLLMSTGEIRSIDRVSQDNATTINTDKNKKPHCVAFCLYQERNIPPQPYLLVVVLHHINLN